MLSEISLNFGSFFCLSELDLGGFGMSKNRGKCGSVCSDSIVSVRNIISNLGAFWLGLREGLGSILGGSLSHVGVKSCPKGMFKASSFSRCVLKPKKNSKKPILKGSAAWLPGRRREGVPQLGECESDCNLLESVFGRSLPGFGLVVTLPGDA